jgi:hypothetical protein
MSESKYPLINGVFTPELRAEEELKASRAVRLRVRSDGTFPGTSVVAVHEDGTEHAIVFCDRIDISITPAGARATIHVTDVVVDVEAAPGAAPVTAGPTINNFAVHVHGADVSPEAVRGALVSALESSAAVHVSAA